MHCTSIVFNNRKGSPYSEDQYPVSYTGSPGWGGGNVLHRRIFFGGVMYYIGEINTGVPPGLGGGGTFDFGGSGGAV